MSSVLWDKFVWRLSKGVRVSLIDEKPRELHRFHSMVWISFLGEAIKV